MEKISQKDLKLYQTDQLSIHDLRTKHDKGKNWNLDKRRGVWLFQKYAKDYTGKARLYQARTISEWETKVENGKIRPSLATNVDLDGTFLQILESFHNSKKDNAPRTYIDDGRIVEKIKRTFLAKKKFIELNTYDMEWLFEEAKTNNPKTQYGNKSKSPREARKTINFVKSCYNWLINIKDINIESPIRKSLITTINKQVKRYTQSKPAIEKIIFISQIDAILESVKDTAEEIIYLLQIYCGLRIAEALGMSYKHLDIGSGLVHVRQQVQEINETRLEGHEDAGKNLHQIHLTNNLKTESSKRSIPMPQAIRDWLTRNPCDGNNDQLVFTTLNQNNGVCSRSNWDTKHNKPIMKSLGLNDEFVSLTHSLRKYFISQSMDNSIGIAEVARQAGHSNVQTTYNSYITVIRDETKTIKTVEDSMREYRERKQQLLNPIVIPNEKLKSLIQVG